MQATQDKLQEVETKLLPQAVKEVRSDIQSVLGPNQKAVIFAKKHNLSVHALDKRLEQAEAAVMALQQGGGCSPGTAVTQAPPEQQPAAEPTRGPGRPKNPQYTGMSHLSASPPSRGTLPGPAQRAVPPPHPRHLAPRPPRPPPPRRHPPHLPPTRQTMRMTSWRAKLLQWSKLNANWRSKRQRQW